MNITVSVAGYAKAYINKNVATNVCGDIPPTIPVNIDCSLCKIGFPQAGGQIAVSFYGPICPPATTPSPSFWLGFEQKTAQFKCPNTGTSIELNPDRWIATTYFGGISTGSCTQQYKMVAVLDAVGVGQINISVNVYVLRPGLSGNVWVNYISFTNPAPLNEIPSLDTTKYRSRMWNSGGVFPVTPQIQGGIGDPVSYASYTIGTYSMRLGCGSVNNDIPDTCGMWNGEHWVTCFRGFIKSTSNTLIREFTQLGFNPNPCGQIGQQYCLCDSFTLASLSPPATSILAPPVNNLDPQFVIDYGVLGLPGGIEAVGARQQIQIASGTSAGIAVCVKQIDYGDIYICTNDNGAGWICSVATVENASGPRILSATRSNFVVYLYTLNFPNPNILNEECYTEVSEGLPPDSSSEKVESTTPPEVLSNTRLMIDRLRNPCKYLLKQIEDQASCGCGTNVKFGCSKHGVCRKIDGLGQVRQCITCEDYCSG